MSHREMSFGGLTHDLFLFFSLGELNLQPSFTSQYICSACPSWNDPQKRARKAMPSGKQEVCRTRNTLWTGLFFLNLYGWSNIGWIQAFLFEKHDIWQTCSLSWVDPQKKPRPKRHIKSAVLVWGTLPESIPPLPEIKANEGDEILIQNTR